MSLRLAAALLLLVGCKQLEESQAARGREGSAKIGVDTLAMHAKLFQSNNPGVDCPTVADLRKDGLSAKEVVDPWGHDYVLKCDGANIVVISKGADKLEGTGDDVRSDRALGRR